MRDGRATLGFSAEDVKLAFREFKGQKCMIENGNRVVPDSTVFVLGNRSARKDKDTAPALSTDANAICTGSNSGYQAVNIAWLAGAKRIILLGLDMSFIGGRSHNHDGHPRNQHEPAYKRWGDYFSRMLPQLEESGCDVINCSTGRGIKAFPFRDLDGVLADP